MVKVINIISRKLIKPCTPTPLHHNKYKISFIDELNPPCNINIILFYNTPIPIPQLEESLANILPQFYPLAGRYIETDRSVDCNDEGAEFVLAKAPEIELDDLTTRSVHDDSMNDLLSRHFYEMDGPTDPLLSIQITSLKHGDLAIAISVSHRVFDASSLGTFVAAWSNANINGGGNDTIAPSFDSASLFPGKNPPRRSFYRRLLKTRDPNMALKRVVFSKEDIDKLRSKISIGSGDQPKVFVSRVRLVSAFIAKALMCMDRAKQGKQPGASFEIIQPVNVRARTIPPLPKHSCGNLALSSVTWLCRDIAHGETSKQVERFEDLIYILGEAIGKTVTVIGQTFGLESLVNIGGMSTYIPLVITDWGKFGFYEADFGWGNPVLVGFGPMPLQYTTTLLGNKNDGEIEAWVHVNQGDLPCFEQYVNLSVLESEDF